MKLIIGLGNPGKEYESTRHNIGFFVVEQFAAKHDASFLPKPKFKADIAELTVNGEKVILAKPTTYYNLSGEAARAISDFYKIAPENVLVVHDELDLPFGTVRSRIGGSSAGNNGVQSITSYLGPDTARLRVGSSNEHHRQVSGRDFVLSKLATHEKEQFERIGAVCDKQIEAFIRSDLSAHSERIIESPVAEE